jgi:hypothetical protein
MRVVHFYPWGCFYPTSSGADVVAQHQLEYFHARGWEVDCLVTWSDRNTSTLDEFRNHYSWVHEIAFLDVPSFPSFTFEGLMDTYCRLKSSRALLRCLRAGADLFFANYFFSAPLLDLLPRSCKRVLETCDILTDQFLAHERASASGDDGRSGPLTPARRRYFLGIETSLFRLYDATILIQPDELQSVTGADDCNLHYVPRMHSPSEAPPKDLSGPPRYDLLFIGSDHLPNREGINWFCRHVYDPYLSKHKVRLAIVGQVCNHVDYASPCVEKLGVVTNSSNSLADLYASAALVIVPIFTGTGLSIKTIEALAMGSAVVSTPMGARGLANCREALAYVDMRADPAEAARVILDVLRSPAKRQELQRAARAYVEQHHSQEAYFAAMDNVMKSIGIQSQAA